MPVGLSLKQRELHGRAVRFAADFLVSREDLRRVDATPSDIWKAFADNGLLGLTSSRKFGGLGGNLLDLAVVADALTRHGGNPGVVLSWLLNEMIANVLTVESTSARQKTRYLTRMASGGLIAAIAVSEPGTGAWRDRLATRAERRSDGFVLCGEKTFVTNGPVADLFIFIAVTGNRDGKNELSAFLVPADSPGLTRTKPLSLPFLRPCPHGGILLDDCVVPGDSLLGRAGRGYEEVAVRFRAVEDVMLMALFTGVMSAQLDLVVADSTRAQAEENIVIELGKLRILRDAARSLAYSGAAMLGGREVPAEALAISLACRGLAEKFQAVLQQLLERFPGKGQTDLSLLASDLAGLLSIAKPIVAQRQRRLGAELIKGEK